MSHRSSRRHGPTGHALIARVAGVSPVVTAVQGDVAGLGGGCPGGPVAGAGPARVGGVLGGGGRPVPVIHVVHDASPDEFPTASARHPVAGRWPADQAPLRLCKISTKRRIAMPSLPESRSHVTLRALLSHRLRQNRGWLSPWRDRPRGRPPRRSWR